MSEDVNAIFTGERYVPGINDPELQMEHFQRYESILEIVKDKVVVDAACGEGYGTSLIGSVAQKVVGLDIEPEAVGRAREKYANEKVSFEVGDISDLHLEEHSVDVFVSFETIEHVPEQVQLAFVPQVHKVLKEDGIFIVSTPNKEIYSDLFNYQNEYHVHEFYKQEFVDLLKKYFKNVKLFHQYSEVAMILDSNESYRETAIYKKNRESYTSDGKYFIAVASNKDIDDIVMESVYLNHNVTHRNNIQRILELQNGEEERNKHIKHLDEQIEEKNGHINLLLREKEELSIHLKKLNNEVAQKTEELKKNIEECRILQEKNEALVYESQSDKQQLQMQDAHIKNLERIINEQDTHIKYITIGHEKWMRLTNNPVMKLLKLPKRVLRKLYRIYKTRTVYRKLHFRKEDNPKVSIVIPVYNQFDYTYKCLKSILENSKDVAYEVIIGDDVSTDRTQMLEKLVSNIKVLHNTTNLKFLLNCNQAAKHARGEYVLFLNNDTQVTEGWLSALVKLIESDESIGMVGSKLIYPNGVLQEAGGIIWSDASGWNYGRNDDASKAEYNYVREVDYISGASIMIRKNLWEEIGGFDELFAPAYYEDADLAFEVRKKGYKVVYQPESVVIHFEGISNGTDLNSGLKKYQVENGEKFKEKWKDELQKQCESGCEVFKAKDRLQDGRKVVLIVDHYVPTFDKDAGSRTVMQYIKMFLKYGYCVKFIGDNYAKMEPYVTILQQMGVEVYWGVWFMENMFQYLEENEKYIDYIFLNRPHISIKYINFMKEKMHARIMFYGSDLHYMRVEREAELTGDEEKAKEALYWKTMEHNLLRKVDVAYYLSPVEKEEIAKFDPNILVRNMKIYIYEKFKENLNLDFANRKGIIFVGGFAHTPNRDAVQWFLEEVYPLVAPNGEIPFYIVGSNPPEELQKLCRPGVILKGYVSDEELDELYASCKIAVVPLRYGAGIKGKVIEALYHGIPLITTGIGAEGIDRIEEYADIVDGAEAFADKILELYGDNDRLIHRAEQSQIYVKEMFSEEAAWNVIKDDFS